MSAPLTQFLSLLSDRAATAVAAAATRLAAVHLGAGPPICATLWSADFGVTCAGSLPEQDRYSLALDGGIAVGWLAWRDEASGLAGLQLDRRQALPATPAPGTTAPGTLLISLGIDAAGAKMGALAVLGEPSMGRYEPPDRAFYPIDRVLGPGDLGGNLIAPNGAMIGILTRRADGEGCVIPAATIARLVAGAQTIGSELDPGQPHGEARGWLGVQLQPAAVPRALRPLAGQNSGRRVIATVPDGPAEQAGLLAGDLLLTIAELSMVGSGAVRGFLSLRRIGETAEMVLVRGGELISLDITVGRRPRA